MEEDLRNEKLVKTELKIEFTGMPIPADFMTFDRIRQMARVGRIANGSFEKVLKMPSPYSEHRNLSQEERWTLKLDRYNRYSQKPFDENKECSPSPGAYSLISYWKGKPSKPNEPQLPNLLGRISKGVRKNPYYDTLR